MGEIVLEGVGGTEEANSSGLQEGITEGTFGKEGEGFIVIGGATSSSEESERSTTGQTPGSVLTLIKKGDFVVHVEERRGVSFAVGAPICESGRP